jgi:hypothetical protein
MTSVIYCRYVGGIGNHLCFSLTARNNPTHKRESGRERERKMVMMMLNNNTTIRSEEEEKERERERETVQ